MSTHRLSPAERAERMRAAHEILAVEVEALTSDDAWIEYLRFMARFPSRSARNNFLIKAQCPNASMVLGYVEWTKLGRHVRRGEKGIRIFAPLKRRIEREDADTGEAELHRVLTGFSVVSVFDVASTEGDPVPELPARPTLVAGDAPSGMWHDLVEQITVAGYTLELVESIADHPQANGITRFPSRHIEVATSDRPLAAQAKTAVHELAHVLLHASGQTRREVAEVEAESVAFLVADAWGLDTTGYSAPYVAAWRAHDAPTVLAIADRVQRCAFDIITHRDDTNDAAAMLIATSR